MVDCCWQEYLLPTQRHVRVLLCLVLRQPEMLSASYFASERFLQAFYICTYTNQLASAATLSFPKSFTAELS